MTETTHCLVSHPKFFCNVPSSVHRPYCISGPLNRAGNFKLSTCIILAVCQSFFSVSCRLSGRQPLPWSRNPVAMSILHQQSPFLWVLHIQFLQHKIKQSRRAVPCPNGQSCHIRSKLHNEFLQCPSSFLMQVVLPGAVVPHCQEKP